MNADGWTEGDGGIPPLPWRPTDEELKGFWTGGPEGEGIRAFYRDLMGIPTPPLRFLCTACDGDGRITHLDAAENRWDMSCPVCEGTGSMTIVPERKGTR